MHSEIRNRAIAAGIAAGLVSAMALLTLSHSTADARRLALPVPSAPSPVVARIAASASMDAAKARMEMMSVYRRNALATGADYRAAAQLFEKSADKKDLLMAHDFAIASLALGDGESRPIVARTEDRLFRDAGLGERFGTLGGKTLPLTEAHRQLLQGSTMPVAAAAPTVAVRPIKASAG